MAQKVRKVANTEAFISAGLDDETQLWHGFIAVYREGQFETIEETLTVEGFPTAEEAKNAIGKQFPDIAIWVEVDGKDTYSYPFWTGREERKTRVGLKKLKKAQQKKVKEKKGRKSYGLIRRNRNDEGNGEGRKGNPS